MLHSPSVHFDDCQNAYWLIVYPHHKRIRIHRYEEPNWRFRASLSGGIPMPLSDTS